MGINPNVIETEVDVKEIKLSETHDINLAINDECNKMGQIGYDLVSTFLWKDVLRLIFKLSSTKI